MNDRLVKKIRNDYENWLYGLSFRIQEDKSIATGSVICVAKLL